MSLTSIVQNTIRKTSPVIARRLCDRSLAKARSSAKEYVRHKDEFRLYLQFCERAQPSRYDDWQMNYNIRKYQETAQDLVERTNHKYARARAWETRQEVAEERLVFYTGTAHVLANCPVERLLHYRTLVEDVRSIAPTSTVLGKVDEKIIGEGTCDKHDTQDHITMFKTAGYEKEAKALAALYAEQIMHDQPQRAWEFMKQTMA